VWSSVGLDSYSPHFNATLTRIPLTDRLKREPEASKCASETNAHKALEAI
jgi:hypothetical protein